MAMNFLEEKILMDATIKQGNLLKIDNFLNHQIDINIMRQIADEIKHRFQDVEVNKVLTIEASGIAIATMVGCLFDVPIVFAKKGESAIVSEDKYESQAYSFTHKKNLHDKLKIIVKENALQLISHPYGNFVIQVVVECWNDYEEILCLFDKKYYSLSLEKYGSNVVERCIEKDDKILNNYIDEIVNMNKIYYEN